MTGRRTFANNDDRESYELDTLDSHEARLGTAEADITALEARPLPPGAGTASDIAAIESGDATAAGATGRYADAAHQHAVATPGAPTVSAVGDAADAGTATALARSDHRHAREGFGSPGASAVGDASAAGVAATPARSDHRHSREAFASPVALTSSTTGAAGSASTVPRSDHRHAFPADVLTTPSQTNKRTHVGSYSGTTDGSSFLTVTHGAGFTPTQVFLQSSGPSGGTNQGYPVVTAITATTFTMRYMATAGSTVSIAVSGHYECRA